MATFVLVHGAFRGGWCWDFVREILESAGHEVYAPDLMGAGDRVNERPASPNPDGVIGLADSLVDPGDGVVETADRVVKSADRVVEPAVTLDLWAGEIATVLTTAVRAMEVPLQAVSDREAPHTAVKPVPRRAILVGHSQGGLVALAASELAAQDIERIVLIDSPVPEPGQSSADLIPEEIRAQFTPPPPDAWLPPTPVTSSDELSAGLADWINARLTPTPAHPGYDPLRLSSQAALDLPRHYYFCAKTPPLFPSSFTRAQFDERGTPYAVLDCGHDAPLTHPELVANVLQSLVTPATAP